jgi:8-oxo-dGTP pyrophosphatase MutT (NUDIX family)
MIKRVLNVKDPWSGHYAFPGGRVEKGEGHKEAALRETSEEVGLGVSEESYLGQFYSFQIKVKDEPINLGISSHLSVLSGGLPKLTPQPKEVQEAFWFKVGDLLNPNHVTSQNFKGFTGSFHRPCIVFEGHTIWGISYFILRELLLQYEGMALEENLIIDAGVLPLA